MSRPDDLSDHDHAAQVLFLWSIDAADPTDVKTWRNRHTNRFLTQHEQQQVFRATPEAWHDTLTLLALDTEHEASNNLWNETIRNARHNPNSRDW